MIFNIDKETLPREDIEALQLRRLQDLCSRVYANVPFYRKRFDESGIKPGDIKSLADLKNLPFTEKQDLRDQLQFDREEIARLNQKLQELQSSRAAYETSLETVYESSSWKLTAPLRALRRMMRG